MRAFIAAGLASLLALCLYPAAGATAASCDSFNPYGQPKSKQAESNNVVVCEKSDDGSKAFYVTDYDRDDVAPRWVAYKLTRDQMLAAAKSKITRKKDGIDFQADPQIEDADFASPNHGDYNGIQKKGYDRGHFLNADVMKWDLDAYHSTFRVSNIALQASYFNEHLWQSVETQERGWACDHGTLYAVTGVIFGGPHAASFKPAGEDFKIFVPTHYWKAVYTPDGGGNAAAIIYKNVKNAGTLKADSLISVDELEKLTGLNFFPDMKADDQKRIEKAKPSSAFWSVGYKNQFKCK